MAISRCCIDSRGSSSGRGAVLIAVLWVCALLSWVGLMYAAETRFQAERARTVIERDRGLYLALSGLHETLARIVNDSPVSAMGGETISPDGKPWRFDYTDGHAMVRVEDEYDKVNINLVSRDELELLLQEAGYEDEAAAVASEIDAYMNHPDRLGRADGDFVPRGGLETLEQMVLYPSVDTVMFYGEKPYDMDSQAKEYEEDKTDLFSLFTVVGKRRTSLDEDSEDEARFQDGGVYRVVSVGRVSEISAARAVWAVFKYRKDDPRGMQILYRKIL